MKTIKNGVVNITDSSISITIGLFLLSLVAGVAYVVWGNVSKTSEVSLVNNIIMETRGMISSNGYGTEDYVPALIAGGSIPSSVTVSRGKIYNKSGGVITVVGNGVGFIVSSTKLSKKACIGLAKGVGTADLESTKINSTTLTGEVTAVAAKTACSSEANTVVFTTKS
ncbi:MAG: type 4 pilus major pilin [Sodalis sp. (in: enterobacteria)]|uniref:type 4 pilus major pilin n=1 Tax=Sodalis sp. (in: enterobacteria) TaxID=1898979 RepID=UPI0039E36CFF